MMIKAKVYRCIVEVLLIVALVRLVLALKHNFTTQPISQEIVQEINGEVITSASEKSFDENTNFDDQETPTEANSIVSSVPPSSTTDEFHELHRADAEVEVRISNDGLFLEPDWDSLVDEKLKNTKRIVIDFEIKIFTDRYNLSDSSFTEKETLSAFQMVANIWAKANIWTRFKVNDIKRKIELEEEKADAYRWWIMGMKSNKDRFKEFFKRDYDNMLVNGPAKLGAAKAEKVIKKYFAHGGHDLFNWILGAGGDRVGPITSAVPLYFMHFFPWYNGMGNQRRIYIRNGSCNAKEKQVDGKTVTCVGWGKRFWETAKFSLSEYIRIVAHEIGHTFGLHHPSPNCIQAKTIQRALLMQQQRSTSLTGRKCGIGNPVAKHSRYLPLKSCIAARKAAQVLSRKQASARQLVVRD